MSSRLSIIARATATLGVLVATVGGATYALTSNQATLGDTTMSTASASLKIYNFDQSKYDTQAPGFTITNLVPGVGSNQAFYLQNDGGVPLNVYAYVPKLPDAPSGSTASNSGYGFTGFENVIVEIQGKCGAIVKTNLLALNAGQVALPCNTLAAGAAGDSNTPTEGNYNVHFDIKSEAVKGSSAGVGPFKIIFSGSSDANVPPTTQS